MNKTLTNLLRSAFAVICIICGLNAANAQAWVIASGGTSTDALTCTIGEILVGENVGMWNDATDITSGIDGIITDGEFVVSNGAANKALNIQLSDAMIAAGAFYNVYNVQGMLLESNKIGTTDFVLNYGHLLRSTRIIITINTSKGVVATYKLSK